MRIAATITSGSLKPLFLVPVLALLAAPTPVFSAMIQPNTAVASSFYDANYSPLHTIDGTGLPSGFTPADDHAPYAPGNMWATASGQVTTDAFIVWGFATPQSLDRAYVWNHGSGWYDATLIDLTLYDSGNNVLLALNDVSLSPFDLSSQTVLFGGVYAGVSSVRLDIEANISSAYAGLAEVAFETAVASVPEPMTLALLGLGLAGLGFARRRS